MMRNKPLCLAAILLTACTPAEAPPAASAPPPAEAAPDGVILPYDAAGLDRLLHNKGITLQWIDWNTRGSVATRMDDGVLHLTGVQSAANGPGKLLVDGTVIEIGSDYFILKGRIKITDTPDAGRSCEQDKFWHFAITQNRPYYRLREFEWCDDLTDYVDIYF